MDERGTAGTADAVVVSEAFTAARELLRQAEEDAARIRADADRYRRQREQEVELLVAKARRLLELSEQRAAAPRPAVVDLDAAPQEAWERNARLVLDDLDDEPIGPGSRRTRSELDSILATAVSNAVHRALPSDR